jgi:cytochrome b561
MTVDRPRYGAVAIALHWLVVALIIGSWTLGLYMVGLSLSPQKLKFISWHKWLGVTIFLIALCRVAWRATHPAPPPPDAMPSWQRVAMGVSHLLLYLLVIVIPLTGWLFSSASGVPTVYLGWVQLPDLVTQDKLFAELLRQAHVSLNLTLFVIVCIHAAAALKHHFLDRDEVLVRMLPFLRIPGEHR